MTHPLPRVSRRRFEASGWAQDVKRRTAGPRPSDGNGVLAQEGPQRSFNEMSRAGRSDEAPLLQTCVKQNRHTHVGFTLRHRVVDESRPRGPSLVPARNQQGAPPSPTWPPVRLAETTSPRRCHPDGHRGQPEEAQPSASRPGAPPAAFPNARARPPRGHLPAHRQLRAPPRSIDPAVSRFRPGTRQPRAPRHPRSHRPRAAHPRERSGHVHKFRPGTDPAPRQPLPGLPALIQSQPAP